MSSSTRGSEAVRLLEATWSAAQRIVTDTPEVALTIKSSGRTRGGITLGHYAPGRFAADGNPLPEVMIAGETINRGAKEILTTVLHEAAHATAKARGVKDTSRQGRYHNKRFVAIAEEYHLTYDHPNNYRYTTTRKDTTPTLRLVPDDHIGYSNVQLVPGAETLYAGVIDLLTKEFPFDLGHPRPTATAPRQRWHGYLLFPDDPRLQHPNYSIVQLSPQKYSLLELHLHDHHYITSTATLYEVAAYLYESGITTDQPDPNYFFDVVQCEHDHPEITQLTKDLLTR